MERQKLIKIIIGVVIAALILFVILPFGYVLWTNNARYGRVETPAPFNFAADEFKDLEVEELSIPKDRGQTLAGRLYRKADSNPDALIVLAHDHGMGHRAYLPVIDTFAKQDFLILVYDATGTDQSNKKAVRGLPQYLLDLDYVLDFVRTDAEFKDLPVLLWGHGAGGYAALNALGDHQDVTATVSLAGFNKASDITRVQLQKSLGDATDLLLPYFELYDRLRFGKAVDSTAVAAINPKDPEDPQTAPQGPILLVQSSDDPKIPMEIGYNIFLLNYHNDPRFNFKLYRDRGHDLVFYDPDSIAYLTVQREAFEVHFANATPGPEEATAWWQTNLDRARAFKVDRELLEAMVAFYREAIEQR